MGLAFCVPAATARTGPELWSIQLDGGLFVLNEASGPNPTAGVRYSKHFTSHVQGGLMTALAYKGSRLEAPTAGTQGSESHVELANTSAGLVPLMAFMQVDLTDRFWLVPFVGVGAGYEWLRLRTNDHRTGEVAVVTYGNIAWEGYAGAGVRVTSRVRVNGELFYNGGSLERPVLDPSGGTWREAVHVNGVGARVGLDLVFE
jgi:opacity protein-like surface antigen